MSTPEPTSAQPKISQKLIVRTAVCLFLFLALFLGYKWVEGKHGDFDPGASDTVGMIAAIEQKPEGQQSVVIHADGSMTETGGWKDGVNDRDLAWSPDGRFIYFVSDRDTKAFDLYRRNPSGTDAKQVTGGTRSRGNPTFPVDSQVDPNSDMLMICGGMVQGYDPVTKKTPQLLPLTQKNITEGSAEDVNGGPEAEFEAEFGSLGTAFRYARWCKNDRYIAAVMQRDTGEVLIIQDMQFRDGKLPTPEVVVAGEHIEFDINPKDGTVVYTVQGFRFPDPEHVPAEFKKNNKITRPFAHAIGFVDPESHKIGLIGASMDDKHSFGWPAISPDGSAVLVAEGAYDSSSENLLSSELLTMPLEPGGLRLSTALARGTVKEPNWSPDGNVIAYTVLNGSQHEIHTIHKDGSSDTNLTQGKGDFSSPKFSPQVKAG